MLSEKDFWDSLPHDLQSSLEPILDRYQRHLMVLEAEVAELRDVLSQLQGPLNQHSRTTLALPATSIWLQQSGHGEES